MKKVARKKVRTLKKRKTLRIEKIKWLVVIRTAKGNPYSFPFSIKKDAMDFAKDGGFSKGKRKVYIYKITNKLVKVME